MLQSFQNKYCKQVFLELVLLEMMSLSDKRDMHDRLDIVQAIVVDFYLENPIWRIWDRFSVLTPVQYCPLYFFCNTGGQTERGQVPALLRDRKPGNTEVTFTLYLTLEYKVL